MRFIVANYGMRHAGMLLAHLHSVFETHPMAYATLYWQDMPESYVEGLQATFPRLTLTKTAFDFSADRIQRISSKVRCWTRGALEHAAEPHLIFADADTVVLKDLSGFFQDAPVVFTYKSGKIPLNTGVLLARGGSESSAFFEEWTRRTVEILSRPELAAQANDFSLPFGAADQMALHQMIMYRPGLTEYFARAGAGLVRLRGERCEQLNETQSRPLSDEIHLIHYKGGWQHILLDGRPFSRFRPRRESWEMFCLYYRNLSRALDAFNRATGLSYRFHDVGVAHPWYLGADSRFLPLHYAAWRVKEAGKRAWLLICGKL